MSSSFACLVTAVGPDDAALAVAVAPALRSSAGVRKPVNSATFIARAMADGCVTTIVLPAASAADGGRADDRPDTVRARASREVDVLRVGVPLAVAARY